MKYILTEEELQDLVPKKQLTISKEALAIARRRILELSKFQCIHESRDNSCCDGCPCLATDEENKEYEFKIGSRHDLYQRHLLICTLHKNFSK